jgi:hypothetical protein
MELARAHGFRKARPGTIHGMKYVFAALLICLLSASGFAQSAPTSATVPVTLDHDRIIIDVRFPMPDGGKKRVRAWVDNGNPEMEITADLAKTLSLASAGNDAKTPSVEPPRDIIVGGITIHPSDIKAARTVTGRDSIAPGSSAEINLPSTVLRHYDLMVDYLNRELTIGVPGSVHFEGESAKAIVNAENGLIQIPSKLAGEKQNLALDLGASWSFVSSEVFAKLEKANPKWPHMTGAVGSANMWGADEEAQWELLRIPSFQYGPLTLDEVGVASFPKERMAWFEKRAGVSTAGLIGANALLNYGVGLDYAHSTVYFQQTSKHRPPDMDVIGLVLRPEADGHYTVVGVADFDGKPSVPEAKSGDILVSIDGTPPTGGTMGETWSLLGGSPGDVRTLVFERAGKQFTVQATVHRFLSAESVNP